jgi:hypothetical protein
MVHYRTIFLGGGLIVTLAIAVLLYTNVRGPGPNPAVPSASVHTDEVAKEAGAKVTPTTPPLKIEPK